jgi:DNA topoisomerase-2
MSSSEENFDFLDDISDNESEGYSPVAKKTVGLSCCLWLATHNNLAPCNHQSKAAPKPPPKSKAKAPAKPKPAAKRVLADVDENAEESFVVDDGDDSGPSAPRPGPATAPKNKKSASETYTKVVRFNIYTVAQIDGYATALPTRTYSQTTRLVYRQCRVCYTEHLDV